MPQARTPLASQSTQDRLAIALEIGKDLEQGGGCRRKSLLPTVRAVTQASSSNACASSVGFVIIGQ
jgi:hypothetical protein